MALTQVTGGVIASGVTITNPTISGYLNLPTWTTGTRPGSPATGQAGFNTTLGVLETYNGTAWVSGGGLNLQAVQTTGFTAVAGNSYPCNTTSAAFTVTLPASPTAGNQVQIIDYAGTFATNNVTLGRNGSNITGNTDGYLLRTNRQSTILTYIDATQGWVVSSVAYTTSPLSSFYTVDYLIVAGGAGGGGGERTNGFGGGGGGGGAGGLLYGSYNVLPTTAFSLVVGGGGATGVQGVPSDATTGANGSNSSGFSLTAIGGGGGAGDETAAVGNGGSGGGAGGDNGTFGSGTSGQGFNGGVRSGRSGGGGGGATEVGSTDGASQGGDGYTWLNGSTYAGGGGGGRGDAATSNAAGGDGGGGTGGATNGTSGDNQGYGGETSGGTNTGGGGGGKAAGRSNDSRGAGGSGIVIIRYAGSQRGTGGTVTSAGGYTYHTFTSSGTYTA